ncbi:RHS repeat-associated core domain-containing protein [Alkalimonas sp. NCh-2]|uniref:RHS repeat domain-containing protein n=1 Tax=Alkalimonas sp. NCh-2 TaxID=3144846 RepID=UPI0031F691A6
MGNQTHQYNNGSLVRQINYNAIGKASYIRSEGAEAASGRSAGETRFTYDGSRNQVRRHSTEQGTTSTIIQQGGVELIIEGGARRYRRNLGNAIVERSGDSITTRYVYTDHLGSVDVITNAIGQLIEKLSFDAFGKRRAVFTSSGQSIALNLSTLLAITHQGFTGHQQVDHAGIVQMGGRIYDAHIGRFLQADPFVQSPSNSQNFNRYSYVLNNPLSYTDPSGYFHNPLKKVGRGLIRGAVKVFGADVVNFVGSAVSMFYGGAWGAAAWNYEFNRAMGASSSAAFKSAAIAGASAWAFSAIGSYYELNASGSINFGGNMLTAGQVAGQITAHAMVGGVAASLQGGKFGHGFFSAGVTKGLGGAFLPGGSELSASEVMYGTVVSAMIGGTASVVAGGKFANGAQTAAMQYLMNQAARAGSRKRSRVWNPVKQEFQTLDAGMVPRYMDNDLLLDPHTLDVVGWHVDFAFLEAVYGENAVLLSCQAMIDTCRTMTTPVTNLNKPRVKVPSGGNVPKHAIIQGAGWRIMAPIPSAVMSVGIEGMTQAWCSNNNAIVSACGG